MDNYGGKIVISGKYFIKILSIALRNGIPAGTSLHCNDREWFRGNLISMAPEYFPEYPDELCEKKDRDDYGANIAAWEEYTQIIRYPAL